MFYLYLAAAARARVLADVAWIRRQPQRLRLLDAAYQHSRQQAGLALDDMASFLQEAKEEIALAQGHAKVILTDDYIARLRVYTSATQRYNQELRHRSAQYKRRMLTA